MQEPVVVKDTGNVAIKLSLISFLPAQTFNVVNNVGEDIRVLVNGRDINIQKG